MTRPVSPLLSESAVPPQIEVAFQALGYCRTVTDGPAPVLDPLERVRGRVPRAGHQRALTVLEKGMEVAALNLIRNYLSGEMELGGAPDWWDESVEALRPPGEIGMAELDSDEASDPSGAA